MKAHVGDACPVPPLTQVRVYLGEDAHECGYANEFNWGPGVGPDGEGRILRYEVLSVGDVTSSEPGTGARFNAGKPPMELIPLEILARYHDWAARSVARSAGDVRPEWTDALKHLGAFQMRTASEPRTDFLLQALWLINADGQAWAECAAVFDYGRAKYAAWNWAKGMPWSVPIGCAARHALAALRGEALDSESKLTHRGHFFCNVVMLLWFCEHYTEGDDRPRLAVSSSPDRFVSAKPQREAASAQA